MSPQIKEMMDRATMVLEIIGVVVAYFGILAAVMYAVLQVGG